jgi:hypothetical protein
MQTDSSFFPSNFSDNGTKEYAIRAAELNQRLNNPTGKATPKPSPTSIKEVLNQIIVQVPPKHGTFIITKDVEGRFVGATKGFQEGKPPKRKFLKGERVEGYLEATVAGASVKVRQRELIVGQFRIPSGYFEEENKASNTGIAPDTSNHNYGFTKDFKAISGDKPSDEDKKGIFTPKNILIGLSIAGVLYFVFKPKK